MKHCIVLAAALVSACAFGETRWYVKDGKPSGLCDENGKRVEQMPLKGQCRYYAPATIGGKFAIRAVMAIDKLDKSAASITLGNFELGFSGLDGRMFGLAKGDVPDAVKNGKEFELVAQAEKDRLAVTVDGKKIVDTDWQSRVAPWCTVALRPWRGEMRVKEFSVETGTFAPPPDFKKIGEIKKLAAEFPVKDISGEKERQQVLAAGTEEIYQGHPTSLLLPDLHTVFAVWTIGHGGHCGPIARSDDAGKTWKRIDDIMPAGFTKHWNCPSIYRIIGSDGVGRIWIFSEDKRVDGKRLPMPSVMSEDDGKTWREMPPLGEKFKCVMTFSSMVMLKDGSYLGVFHRGFNGEDRSPLEVLQSVSKDGGFTWSDPVVVARVPGRDLCEPWVFRSPKGDELCCMMRDNKHVLASMMMFSRDEGKSWTEPEESPWALGGDRHQGVQLEDGRLCVVFRDTAVHSPTRSHFLAWVGPYEALKSGKTEGTHRIKLLHSYGGFDCGYPGIVAFPGNEILATTYIKYWNDKRKNSVVNIRFNPIEVLSRKDRSDLRQTLKSPRAET